MKRPFEETTFKQRWARAFLLWKRYKTEGWEYRRLAESFGMTTGELNARISTVINERKYGSQTTELA